MPPRNCANVAVLAGIEHSGTQPPRDPIVVLPRPTDAGRRALGTHVPFTLCANVNACNDKRTDDAGAHRGLTPIASTSSSPPTDRRQRDCPEQHPDAVSRVLGHGDLDHRDVFMTPDLPAPRPRRPLPLDTGASFLAGHQAPRCRWPWQPDRARWLRNAMANHPTQRAHPHPHRAARRARRAGRNARGAPRPHRRRCWAR